MVASSSKAGSFAPPRRRTLSQAVAEEIAARIQAGDYRPGDALPTERDLMQQFGVGRSSARESMQALAAMGVIDIRPGRGARVLPVAAREALPRRLIARLLEDQAVQDLYEFRRCAEVEVAGRAAERATDADVERINQCVSDYRRAVTRKADLSESDVRFHQALAAAAHNVVFELVLDELVDLLNFARREVMAVPWVPRRALREHVRIAAAVAAHDAQAARAAMSEHIAGAIAAVTQSRSLRGPAS